MEDRFYPVPDSPGEISERYQRTIGLIQKAKDLGLIDIRITGTENAVRGSGKIDAYSHYTDWAEPFWGGFAELSSTGAPVRYMAKSEYYDKRLKFGKRVLELGEVLRSLDGFPIMRNTTDLRAIEHSALLLKKGHIVGIAPQGESIRDKTSRPRLKRGIGLIACIGGAP